MIKSVVQACILANYQKTYKKLPDFYPDHVLLSETNNSVNSFYLADLNGE
jgi:hypothetical protein